MSLSTQSQGLACPLTSSVTDCIITTMHSPSSPSPSSCGLSSGRYHFHKWSTCLPILCSTTGSCQTNVKSSNIRFNCAEPSFARWPDLQCQSLGKGVTLDLSTRQWSMNGSARAMWSKKLRCVVRMTCVSGADQYVCGPLHLKCSPSRKFVTCDADTTDQMRRCFSIVVKWVTMFLLHRARQEKWRLNTIVVL